MKSNNDDFINSEVDMDSNENSTMTTDISFELNMEEIKEVKFFLVIYSRKNIFRQK